MGGMYKYNNVNIQRRYQKNDEYIQMIKSQFILWDCPLKWYFNWVFNGKMTVWLGKV
jgi:hypothetical protein